MLASSNIVVTRLNTHTPLDVKWSMPDKLSDAFTLPDTPDIQPLDPLKQLYQIKHILN